MPYVIMWITSTFFAYLASKAKRRDVVIFFSVIAILIPSVMGGIRANSVGKDTTTYALPHFIAACNAPDFGTFLLSDKRLPKELLWAVLVYVPAKLFGNFNVNLFFFALIIAACSYIAIYKHRKIVQLPFVWLIFLTVIYPMTFNYIRQSLAASVIFMHLDKLEAKQYGKFMLAIAAGILFHSSAFIVLSYLVTFHALTLWKTRKVWLKNLILYGGLVSLIIIRPIIRLVTSSIPFLSTYAGYENNRPGAFFTGLAYAGLEVGELIMCMLYPIGLRKLFQQNDMYKFYMFSLIFHLIYRFFVRIFAFRVLFYFDFINVILIASLPFFVREKNLRNFVAISVFLASVTYFFFTTVFGVITSAGNGSGAWPYRTIFI